MADKKDNFSKKYSSNEYKREEPKEEEIVKKSTTEKFTKPATRKLKILVVDGSDFVAVDEDGKGIRLPIPLKYKNAVKGDVIEI